MNISFLEGVLGLDAERGKSSRRAGLVRTRALTLATVALVAGSAWWVSAQSSKGGVKRSPIAASAGQEKPVSLADLPALMRKYAQARQVVAHNGLGPSGNAAGVGKTKFALTERNLTPNTPSDEREPVYNPTGEFIAFASNGTDANSDGFIDGINAENKFHLWVMNRDGSQQRQITGLTTSGPNSDVNFNQRQPSWSPDGNQIVFNAFGLSNVPGQNTTAAGNIFIVRPFQDGNLSVAGIQPPVEQRTFFTSGTLNRPDFGENSLNIVFAHTGVLELQDQISTNDANATGDTDGANFDVFTISPSGQPGSLRRLTGGAIDPAGGGTVQNTNPVYSFVNQSLIFFTSTRTNSSANNRSRIWLMAGDGSNKRQITDPTKRAAGQATDDDDKAAPSRTTAGSTANTFYFFSERIAFQSNSKIDASDTVQDLNIWTTPIDSNQFLPDPTPTPEPTPKLVVSSFNNNRLIEFDPADGTVNGVFPVPPPPQDTTDNLIQPEGVVFGPDLNNDQYPELYVANRGRNRVDVYDGVTRDFIRVFTSGTGAGSLTNPTGLVFDTQGRLYVASGFAPTGSATPSTNKIHRFDATGAPLPSAGQQGSIFSNGTDGVTNGIEGITFGPDVNADGIRDIYASALLENKITVYDGNSGTYQQDFVAPGAGGLNLPTGLAFAPAGNLFVSSSGTDDVIQYNRNSGALVNVFVDDNNGALFGLNAPEGLTFGPDGNLYVASLDNPQTPTNTFDGDRVLRFYGPTSTSGTPGTPFPAPGTFKPAYAAQNASFTQNFSGLSGPGSLAFYPLTLPPTGTPTPTPTPNVTPLETTGSAAVESNTTSSPTSFTNSQLQPSAFNPLTGQFEAFGADVSADREPAFSRSIATGETVAQLAFSSNRRAASKPGTRLNSDGSPDPRPVVSNPYGGPEGSGTHDIWTTASEDVTPPILVPVGSGNALYPLLAPGPQYNSGSQAAPAAPRTYEQGLIPGSRVRIGVVLDERESGLSSVTVNIYRADLRRYATSTPFINEKIPVRINQELKPTPFAQITLTPYDNGPDTKPLTADSTGERQAGAVAGDGVYYCEGFWTTPAQGADYYIDVVATDRANGGFGSNSFTYDNVFGFSTQQFVKSSTTSDLLVSDYTQGQTFPSLTGDSRFFNMPPVESYFLTNPANIAEGKPQFDTDVTTYDNVDVWRILCRGDVPEQVLGSYTPTVTRQIDPANGATDVNAQGTPQPYTARTRAVAVSNSSVIWASPYTGTVFAAPGTLNDAETQRRLTNYLNLGGRLFVTGRDIVYALSGAGQLSNNFLSNELQASYAGESSADTNSITGLGTNNNGKFTIFPAGGEYDGAFSKADLNNLQVPSRSGSVGNPERTENTYLDAALNNSFFLNGSIPAGTGRTDIIGAGPGGTGVTLDPAYSLAGKNVGQRIEHDNRGPNGFQSRVVFFSFGLEGVNRRYTRNTKQLPFAVNVRSLVADNMRAYFKTGGISGRVVNDATNLPVPNFLIRVTGGPDNVNYFTRTDANGNYEILGLSNNTFTVYQAADGSSYAYRTYDQYVISPAVDATNNSLNPGFSRSFAGAPQGIFVQAPQITPDNNFRIIPAPTSSLSGTAVQSAGTFADRSDDTPLPNVRVLVRSLGTSSIFPNGGKFAALTETDAGGRFNFSSVPADTRLEVIFNPDGRLESQGGDIPDGSGVATFTQDPNFGRRIIPDAARPDNIILSGADVGNAYVLNDGSNDTAADVGDPILIPVGRTINGAVFLNNTPLGGATVTLSGLPNGVITTTTVATTGAFAFFDIPKGTYTLSASFTRGTVTFTNSVSVTVTTQDVSNVRITLFKQDVSGLVTVSGGPPGEALTVDLIPVGASSPLATTQTTNAGNYQFLNVPVDNYTVRVTRRGITRSSAQFTVTKFDPTTGLGGDFVVPTITFFSNTLSGFVTLNGVPTAALRVQLLNANGAPFNPAKTTTTDANGAFTFDDIDNGTYFVSSSIAGRNGTDVGTSVPIAVTSNRNDITVPLFLHTIRGVVRLNNTPSQGQIVELYQSGRVIATVRSGVYGVFSIDKLMATPQGTTFQLRAKRLDANGTLVDVTGFASVTIRRGQSVQGQLPYTVVTPDLVLISQTVSGVVLLNPDVATRGSVYAPQARAVVELTNRARVGNTIRNVTRTVTTDARGRYSFEDVGTGAYSVTAKAAGDALTKSIFLRRGQNQVVNFTLLLQNVTGRILVNRTPLAGQQVLLVQAGRVFNSALSDANGFYTFKRVAAGAYQVRAGRFGDIRNSAIFVVTRGRNATAPTLVLREQSISGRVTVNRVAIRGIAVDLLQGTRVVKRVFTDNAGNYRFGELAPGVYTVRASRNGDSASQTVTIQPLSGRNDAVGAALTVNLELVLQSISGRVLLNSVPLVGQRVDLLQNGRLLKTVNSTTNGAYLFDGLSMGTYVVRAARGGDVVQTEVTLSRTNPAANINLNLRLQTVSGLVTVDGRPASGVTVVLSQSGRAVQAAIRTGRDGTYRFTNVLAGAYVVTASIPRGVITLTGSRSFRVGRGTDVIVPTIALTPASPTPGPTPDSGDEEFQPGTSYQISVPYADTAAPNATTTVTKAFTVPAVAADGTENYKIFRYDARTTSYVQLDNNSQIRRGEGYFLQPQARGVSIRRPVPAGNRAADPTRIPTQVTEFEIVLHRNASLPANARNNGFNLIGFPFNPERFFASSWADAVVIAPDGTRYSTLASAVAAGLVSDTLYTLGAGDEYVPVTNDLVPFQGYYARTFVDGVRVILRPGATRTAP